MSWFKKATIKWNRIPEGNPGTLGVEFSQPISDHVIEVVTVHSGNPMIPVMMFARLIEVLVFKKMLTLAELNYIVAGAKSGGEVEFISIDEDF